MTTDKNNFVFPPRKPRGDGGDVVFTSCSRCFPIDTLAIRSKILDLAMRGKLTEQLPEDGTAEELYRQIQAEKQSLIKAGKIKKEKPLPEIAADEIPFKIPANWKWARLGSIGITATGGTPPKSHPEYYGGDYPFFKPSDLDAGPRIVNASEYLTEDGKKAARHFPRNSILVCCIGSIGKAAIIDTDGTANQQINALTPLNSDSGYLLYAISSGAFQQQLDQGSRATTVSIINKFKFDNCILPLPPLAEQHRIVAKIEQAFSALDTIDTLQAKYAGNLAVLKSKLIDAAIQGKLTEPLPEDGTAEDLYRQIQAEKQALIKAGKIKKEKPLPEITSDEIPFEIPKSWKWVRLGAISESVNVGIVIRPTRYYVPQGQGTPAFRNCNIQQGFIDDGEWVYLNADAAKENPRAVVETGDILVARSGTPGNCCVVTEPYSGRGAVDIVIVRLHQKLALPDFIKAFLCSSFAQKAFLNISRGVALSHLGATTVALLTVPLPPLAEQKRIVAKLEELLPLCERLKKNPER